jgi:hypothetical protein
MITKKDFMKDYRQMNLDEQKSYIERVEKWNGETFPQLMAQVTSWMNVPVKELREGQLLCSAIVRARPFLIASRSYKDVKVVLGKMNSLLVEVAEKSGIRTAPRPLDKNRKWFAATEVKSAPDENGVVTVKKYEEPEVDGRRPQHVSEYVHLLPKNLQQEAMNLKQMHMELAMYRGEAEELSKDAHATKEQVAEKARKAVDTEQRIRLLYATIDAAYKKATNQKLNEDEEALLMQDEEQPQMFKRAGEYTKEEIDAMPAGKMKEDCIAARKEADKKYIRREPKNITDDYKQQLELRVKELQGWGEEITEKMIVMLGNAGVIIEGVNDDLFGAEVNVAKEVKAPEQVFGRIKTELAEILSPELQGNAVVARESDIIEHGEQVSSVSVADVPEADFPKNDATAEP